MYGIILKVLDNCSFFLVVYESVLCKQIAFIEVDKIMNIDLSSLKWNVKNIIASQLIFTCSKSIIETIEKGTKHVQN